MFVGMVVGLGLPHVPWLLAFQQVVEATGAATKDVAIAVVQPQEIGSVLMNGIWIVILQGWVKKLTSYQAFVNWFPGVNKYAHWAFAAVASIIAVSGIHITGQWTAEAGGVYQAQLPALAVIVHNLADYARQFAMQHIIHKGTKDRGFVE